MSDSSKNEAVKKVQEAREKAERRNVKFDQYEEMLKKQIDIEHPVNVVEISTDVRNYADKRIRGFRANAYSEQGETGRVRIHLCIGFVNQIGDNEKVVEEHFVLSRREISSKREIMKKIGDFIMDIPGGDKTILENISLCLVKLVPAFDRNRVMASDRMSAEKTYRGLVKKIQEKSCKDPEYRLAEVDRCKVACLKGYDNFKNLLKEVCGKDWKVTEFRRILKEGFYTDENIFTGSLLIVSENREYTREMFGQDEYYVIKNLINREGKICV